MGTLINAGTVQQIVSTSVRSLLAVALLLGCSSSLSVEQMVPEEQQPKAAAGAAGGSQSVIDRDQLYHRVLETLESLEATWRDRPDQVESLRDDVDALDGALTALCVTPVTAPPSKSTVVKGEKEPPEQAHPSEITVPPSPDEIEEFRRRQMEATLGTHLPGPPLPDSRGQLAHVPRQWLTASCDRATADLAEIRRLLLADEPTRDEVVFHLRSLHLHVQRIPSPPVTPPTDPATSGGDQQG